MERKTLTSIRLTPEAKRLLKLLAAKLGVSQAAILELVIRQKAQEERLI
jgi:predicted DNA-binding protein